MDCRDSNVVLAWSWGTTLETLLQARTSRQADEYFSMVRLRLAWASLLSRSTSFNTSILKPFWPRTSSGLLLAISWYTVHRGRH